MIFITPKVKSKIWLINASNNEVFSYTYIKSVSKRVFQTSFPDSIIVMRYELWYQLYNLKSVKNTYGGVLLLVKLQAGNASFIIKCNVLNMKCKSMH